MLALYDDEKYKTKILLKKGKVFHLIICIFYINGENLESFQPFKVLS